MPYEWAHPKPLRRSGGDVTEGERFEPTEAELRAFSDRIAELDDEEPTEADASDEDVAEALSEPPVDPGTFTVSELRDHLSDVAYGPAELDALAAAEKADSARETALNAIDAARE